MRSVFAVVVIVLMASFASAREMPEADPIPLAHASEYAGCRMAAGAPTDTFQVLGGPGSLDGKFQDAAGLPDDQGWFGVDLSEPPASRWAVGTGQAANLDPENPGNLAWTCQELFEPCSADDPPEGYGDDWNEHLIWTGAVPDPDHGVSVRVRAVWNHDVEPSLDYIYLEFYNDPYWESFGDWTGSALAGRIDETVDVPASAYQEGGTVHLRFRMVSDGAWDDSDCLFYSRGAAQMDSIVVTFDQGEGEQMVGWVETCEPGVPTQWEPMQEPGVGDYARIWPQLDDLDDTTDNVTPRLAFIDDGEVEPDSDGTPCISWCYGPGGWIVCNDEGLSHNRRLDNQFWSPPIPVPVGDLDGAMLAFDLYLHSGDDNAPLIHPTWGLRSTADATGETGWSDWTTTPVALWGGPETVRVVENVSDGLVPGAALVQVALGLRNADLNSGSDGTPVPFFDNVALKLFRRQSATVFSVRPDGLGDAATIQAAVMAAATGDTIELADGIYTGPGNRDVDLLGKSLVIRSVSDDAAACIIDCEAGVDGSHRGFLVGAGTTLDARLRGLTVRGGRQSIRGGALFVTESGAVTVENCRFEDNQVTGSFWYGGAVLVSGAAAVFRDCVFVGNAASLGAALAATAMGQLTLERCLLVDNQAFNEGAGVMAMGTGTQVSVSGCTMVNNLEHTGSGVLRSRASAHIDIDQTIVTGTEQGAAVWCSTLGTVSVACSDFFDNDGGDWVGCAAEFEGLDGNISADPMFCADLAPDQPYGLDVLSPCAPEQNDCGLMGAYGVACELTTGVDDDAAPSALTLAAGVPNPANPATTVRFSLPTAGAVRLHVHDLRGRLVRRLVDADLPAGEHVARWQGRDDAGRAVASGVYVVRLEASGEVRTGRLALIR